MKLEKEWITLTEAAEYASVCVRTMKSWRKSGLRVWKVGRIVRTCREWVDEFMMKNVEA